ncbi:MAG: MBL fold metallo-hydrolase [Methanobacteriales archaeon]|nr:MBL fold metallo-hydrolase [Methanobacteriales archaeon]
MTELSFYGGVDEIGGNKIKVASPDSSFFFDFGLAFSRANTYLSEFLQPRKANGILDFVALGLLPCLKGIYREDYLRHVGLSHPEEPGVEGVLISHSHVDHVSYVHHLREDIPIHLSEESYLILRALEDTGAASFSEYLHLKKSFQLVPKKTGKGYTRKTITVDRDLQITMPYHKFQLGDFQIQSAPVDHSLPGASAYLAENGEGMMVYTGDLRFHGRQPELTHQFVKKARKAQPTTLLCEGTRINSTGNTSEEDIQRKAEEVLQDFKGLVVVNYPVRDLDRLLTFYQVARNTDRQLVVSLKQAYILDLFQGRGYPELDDVLVYQPKKGWGMVTKNTYACQDDEWVCTSDLDPELIQRDYRNWEREFLDQDYTINYQDLQENPEEYLFRCDFFELKELIDIKPEKGIYLKSMTEPFDEEMEVNEEKVRSWLKLFNLPLLKGFHASGHANGEEILDMIREINPEEVYPIHTEGKEQFKVLEEDGIRVRYPKLKFKED